MHSEITEILVNNPLESHRKYGLGDTRNIEYRSGVILKYTSNEHKVGNIIVYDGSVCTHQFLCDYLERIGSMNSHIQLLNDDGYYLLSTKEILALKAKKDKLSKAKGVLNFILVGSVFFLIPLFATYWYNDRSMLIVPILFICLILLIWAVFTSKVLNFKMP
ncbi:hypothetical protein ACFSNA_02465 [Pedobacter mendelii]|uniref:hypothetical protein n=1 Tax=Pedobacter mendelii TaxID=1908240 RepID=UPI00360A24B9